MRIYVGIARKAQGVFGIVDDEEVSAFKSRQAAIDYGVDLVKKSDSFKSCEDKEEVIKVFVNDIEEDGYAPVDLLTDYWVHEVELEEDAK